MLKKEIDELAPQVQQLPPDDERTVAIAEQMAVMNSHLRALDARRQAIAEALGSHEQKKRELQQQLDEMKAAP